MRYLNELYKGMDNIPINAIKINSQEIKPGDIFVCTMGVVADRHDFIDDAIKNGASAIVVSRDNIKASVPVIKVDDTNIELPKLASRFYNHPEEKLKIIGVTGTNGKTTVTQIIQDLIGNDICAYMGTNGIRCHEFNEFIRNTTPDSDRLYNYLSRFVESGCTILSMETSSESFYRKRLTEIDFDISIITNITEDHLNIHRTIDNYIESKLELLKQTKKDGISILNTEDKYYQREKDSCNNKIMTYGKSMEADLRIIDFKLYSDHTDVTIKYQANNYTFESPLIGEFNIYNLCAAILALLNLNYTVEQIILKIPNICSISGRVEMLDYGQNYKIVLDYAHTTDAFLNLYPLLQAIKKKRIITVSGSAGGREHEKRAIMGKLILDNSDYVIFTSDDPRYEDPNEIIDDLLALTTKTNYERVIDREEAIKRAFSLAEEEDIVLVAGKGIDNYMAIEDKYLPYSDPDVIERYFKE